MPNVSTHFQTLIDSIQKYGEGRNPVTGEKLETEKVADDLNLGASESAVKEFE